MRGINMEKDITKNETTQNETCPTVGYQSASICVPVTITPYVQAGVITTKCCGAPIVTTGKVPCQGLKNGTCTFTIAQDICVSVPINFGADAVVGDAYVHCGDATAEDVCSNCTMPPPPIPECSMEVFKKDKDWKMII